MYIKKIEITNIRNIEHFVWELPEGQDLAGWHVLIGDNGSGKTTVLRAIALGLLGIDTNLVLTNHDWDTWLRINKRNGHVKLEIVSSLEYDDFEAEFYADISVFEKFIDDSNLPTRSTNKNLKYGWFSSGYGPFRRFTGGNSDYNRLFRSNPRLAAHLSVFGEDVALIETIEWLKDLNYKQLEGRKESKKLLDSVIKFVNHDNFLPNNILLSNVSSDWVTFTDADRNSITIENLSDGYRSTLSMTLEIIRQMSIFYPNKPLFNNDFTQVIPPGVIIIDEVDAHLHPSWQREIGRKLTELFPNIQFIVTTHSPLVCQLPFTGEGDDKKVKGSIFRLPTPGTDEVGELLKEGSENWKRLVYGDILEAYSTDLFGENIERSPEAQKIMDELAELSALEYARPLTEAERNRLEELMSQLPSTPSKYLEVALERNKKL